MMKWNCFDTLLASSFWQCLPTHTTNSQLSLFSKGSKESIQEFNFNSVHWSVCLCLWKMTCYCTILLFYSSLCFSHPDSTLLFQAGFIHSSCYHWTSPLITGASTSFRPTYHFLPLVCNVKVSSCMPVGCSTTTSQPALISAFDFKRMDEWHAEEAISFSQTQLWIMHNRTWWLC